MTVDIDAVSVLIAEISDAEIAPRFNRLRNEDIMRKQAGDVVTTADLEAERRLTERLLRQLPGSVAVGEEAAESNPSVLDRLDEDRPVWIIDPVDGTRNFARGKPAIAVIVALARGGETIAGWIHDPLARNVVAGERGGGAWQNGRRLTVAAPTDLVGMDGSINLSFFGKRFAAAARLKLGRVAGHGSLGSAGQEYRVLCRGERHFALYRRIKPWDHAAGVMLHTEAGGYSALHDGRPYRPTARAGGILLAPDRTAWTRLHELFFDGLDPAV